MAFRADEEIQDGRERALSYLVPRDLAGIERAQSQHLVNTLIDKYGPVVEHYPSWHPLVSANTEKNYAVTSPEINCGYKGLDHTRLFAHGFVTCPYGDGQSVIDSVNDLPLNPAATIHAERLEGQLYHEGATAILVYCNWHKPLAWDRTIPKSIAVPLLLEQELPCWRHSEVAETWETMRPYFLGAPHGARSSLFVNQETGQVLKNVWNTIINTGMYGPIQVD